MAGVERIIFTFFSLTESAQSSVLTKRMELFAPTGKEFMRVRLIAGIPDDFVGRCIQKVLQGNRELDHTQIRSQVSADISDRSDNLLANFLAQCRKSVRRQPLQIGGIMDRLQYGHRWSPSFSPVSNVAITHARPAPVVRVPNLVESHTRTISSQALMKHLLMSCLTSLVIKERMKMKIV